MATRRRSATPTLFDLEPRVERPARIYRSFAGVALNRPVRRVFTYAVPEPLLPRVAPGMRVAVPFGTRRVLGVVVELGSESALPAGRVKELLDVLDGAPVVGPELLGLTRWIAERYACAWGEALAAALPAPLKRERARRRVAYIRASPGVGRAELESLAAARPEQHRLLRALLESGARLRLRDLLRSSRLSESPARSLRRRGWVEIEYAEDVEDPLGGGPLPSARPRPAQLSPAQTQALEPIRAALEGRAGAAFLLHGVTGSGKTEVYLRAIEQARALGRGAIVLVPEIALTPQTVGWFRARFGEVSVFHSRMSDSRRLAEWQRLQRGDVHVVVGARSAIFAPVKDLGVIVVDEEHEPSFKQESVPRYHAREVALERARRERAVCLLGSATPSMEAWHLSRTGRLERLSLPERVGGGRSCSVLIVDMRLDSERDRRSRFFSRCLTTLLAETLEHHEQAILFLNRRGFVPVLWCPGCQTTLVCERCSLALTYHRRIDRLVCHACCRERALPPACPTCSRPGLRPFGGGSERVEADLARLFPGVRARRMDSDTMRRREDFEQCLGAFERHELDVLVGTQMIAKGLDFPRVTLVGIISADQALHLPDFRSGERTFQLIAQVSGRAGRGLLPGRVVVQTTLPDERAVSLGARGDYEAFVLSEDPVRRENLYPPHARLVRVVFEDREERRVEEQASRFGGELAHMLPKDAAQMLGPIAAPVALLRGRHRWHLLVKVRRDEPLFERVVERLAELAAGIDRPSVTVDVDPMSML